MFRRVLKNPNYYGLPGTSVDQIKEYLHTTVAQIFKKLKDSKCIQVLDDDDVSVMPTEMGFISSAYYLKHQTVAKFNNDLKEGLGFRDILRILADAEEFK